jgi:hypothetical protein
MQKQVDIGVCVEGMRTPLLPTSDKWVDTPVSIEDNYCTAAICNAPV